MIIGHWHDQQMPVSLCLSISFRFLRFVSINEGSHCQNFNHQANVVLWKSWVEDLSKTRFSWNLQILHYLDDYSFLVYLWPFLSLAVEYIQNNWKHGLIITAWNYSNLNIFNLSIWTNLRNLLYNCLLCIFASHFLFVICF